MELQAVVDGDSLRHKVKRMLYRETLRILSSAKDADDSQPGPIVVDHFDNRERDTFYSKEGILVLVDYRVRNVHLGSNIIHRSDYSSLLLGPGRLQLASQSVVSMFLAKLQDDEIVIESFPIYGASAAINDIPMHSMKELKGERNTKSPIQNIYVGALKDAADKIGLAESKLEFHRTEFTKIDSKGVFFLFNGKRFDVDFVPLIGAESNKIVPLQCVVHRRGLFIGEASTPNILVLSD